jgi:two-component system, OmpR family, KDP operon response regulator KdpE
VSRVLVVDDDPQIVRAVRVNLSARGYTVTSAYSGRKALAEAAEVRPDVVVLDLGLPDLDGVDVIADLRRWTSVPIVVLSGRAGSSDKVEALEAGADDYVTKPFDVDELVARIRAVTRRAASLEASAPIRLGGYVVDLDNRRITLAAARPEGGTEADHGGEIDREVHLTPTQWQLLKVLLRSPGRLISQRQLLTEVWGPQYETETHYVRQYMAQLRHKLEPDPARPRHLITELGMGYRYVP